LPWYKISTPVRKIVDGANAGAVEGAGLKKFARESNGLQARRHGIGRFVGCFLRVIDGIIAHVEAGATLENARAMAVHKSPRIFSVHCN
jgi:hypothetical protein